jgi:hypothetical protein
MSNQQTILDGIVEDVSTDLYNKWASALPQEEKNDVAFQALAKNAQETTLFVIQNFMNRFTAEADKLQNSAE